MLWLTLLHWTFGVFSPFFPGIYTSININKIINFVYLKSIYGILLHGYFGNLLLFLSIVVNFLGVPGGSSSFPLLCSTLLYECGTVHRFTLGRRLGWSSLACFEECCEHPHVCLKVQVCVHCE